MENEMETEIGTKEAVALEAAKVKIMNVELEPIKKNEKIIGKKVVCVSKHPAKEEAIAISSVKFEKGNQIKTSGLWLNKDEDNKIQKGSALAIFMNKVGVKTIKELEGKEVDTTLDDKNYLCFKAY